MTSQRTHYATSTDGVVIGGNVHGQGPPLVFLHGAIGDGELDWQALLEHMAGEFTCHLPSWRGRGLSGDHSDLSQGRRVDDVLTYLDSIGDAAGIVGWSGGAYLALAAIAQSEVVDAAALVEPVMAGVMDEQERAALREALARMSELVSDGRLSDAMRVFAGFVLREKEVAEIEGTGYFEAAGRYAPNLLDLHRQQTSYQGLVADDPAVLGTISASVLVLHGSETKPYFARGARQVADHVSNSRLHEIPGAGHASPLTHPAALASALTTFFSAQQRPV